MLRAMRHSQIADAKKPLDAWTITPMDSRG
jgi:hypothetical protein